MDQLHREVIRSCQKFILENLKFDETLMKDLENVKLVTDFRKKMLNEEEHDKLKTQLLIDFVLGSGNQGYYDFVRTLERSKTTANENCAIYLRQTQDDFNSNEKKNLISAKIGQYDLKDKENILIIINSRGIQLEKITEFFQSRNIIVKEITCDENIIEKMKEFTNKDATKYGFIGLIVIAEEKNVGKESKIIFNWKDKQNDQQRNNKCIDKKFFTFFIHDVKYKNIPKLLMFINKSSSPHTELPTEITIDEKFKDTNFNQFNGHVNSFVVELNCLETKVSEPEIKTQTYLNNWIDILNNGHSSTNSSEPIDLPTSIFFANGTSRKSGDHIAIVTVSHANCKLVFK